MNSGEVLFQEAVGFECTKVIDSSILELVTKLEMVETKSKFYVTGRAQLIRSHSSARFCFELSKNLN